MRPIVTERVAWSVGLSVTLVSPAKTAEPIEMPFGLRTPVGPRNHVLDEGPDPSWEGAILRGKGRPIVKYTDALRSSVQKRLNRSRCHGNHFLAFYVWGAHWRHLKNTTEPSMCGGDAALCQITLTTCHT